MTNLVFKLVLNRFATISKSESTHSVLKQFRCTVFDTCGVGTICPSVGQGLGVLKAELPHCAASTNYLDVTRLQVEQEDKRPKNYACGGLALYGGVTKLPHTTWLLYQLRKCYPIL